MCETKSDSIYKSNQYDNSNAPKNSGFVAEKEKGMLASFFKLFYAVKK